MNEQEIEKLLRVAPDPGPPAGLKKQLIAQVRLSKERAPTSVLAQAPGSWLRRWWPALAPGAISLACAAVIALQQVEIDELKRTIQVLSQVADTSDPSTKVSPHTPAAVPISPLSEAEEIARLQQSADGLSGQIRQLQQIRAENEKLRTQLATAPDSGFTSEEQAAMDKARERAWQIQCVNNMKQMCLAARLWASDLNATFPRDLLSISNELGTPKILACPADPAHLPVDNWAAYSSANCSYEFLAASAPDNEPTRVAFHCPIHDTYGLVDGSVQTIQNHSEWLVRRNGVLYLEQPGSPSP